MSRSQRRNSLLVQVLAGGLQAELKLAEDEATSIAHGMVRWIATQAGGDALYCPKTLRADVAVRNAAIRRDFDGRNRDELCRRYRIARSTFYGIVGALRP